MRTRLNYPIGPLHCEMCEEPIERPEHCARNQWTGEHYDGVGKFGVAMHTWCYIDRVINIERCAGRKRVEARGS